jgi:predicted hotdog family 3-hydroxylacyl-ACP dehydratase
MSEFLGPLDSEGRVPRRQQTRIAAFLISAHGALARQFALTLPAKLESAWQTELNAQLYHEAEIVSLLMRATSWVPDFALCSMALSWEAAWLPRPVEDIPDRLQALAVDLAARAHAVHAGIRPAALLPGEANANDPFVMTLRRVELESGRLLQAQTLFLKGRDLVPFRDAVGLALERRHAEVRELWRELLDGIGVNLRGNNEKS